MNKLTKRSPKLWTSLTILEKDVCCEIENKGMELENDTVQKTSTQVQSQIRYRSYCVEDQEEFPSYWKLK